MDVESNIPEERELYGVRTKYAGLSPGRKHARFPLDMLALTCVSPKGSMTA